MSLKKETWKGGKISKSEPLLLSSYFPTGLASSPSHLAATAADVIQSKSHSKSHNFIKNTMLQCLRPKSKNKQKIDNLR